MVAHVPIVPRPGGKQRRTGNEPLVDGCGGPSLGLHISSSIQGRPAGGGRAPAGLSSERPRSRGVRPAPRSNQTPEGQGQLPQELTAAHGHDWKAPADTSVSPSPPSTHSHEQKYCHRSRPDALEHFPAAPETFPAVSSPVPRAQHARPGLPSRTVPMWGGLCAGAAYPPPPSPPHQPLMVPAPCQCSCTATVPSIEAGSAGPLRLLHVKYQNGLDYKPWQKPGQNREALPYSPPHVAVRVDRQPVLWAGGIMELLTMSGASQRMAGEEEAGGSDARESGSGKSDTPSNERSPSRGDNEPRTELSLPKGEIRYAPQRTERKRSAEQARGQAPDESSRPKKRKRSPSCARLIPENPRAEQRSEDSSEKKADPAETTQEEGAKADHPDQSPKPSLSSGEEADIDSSDSDGQRRISHMQRFAGTMTRRETEPMRAERPAPSHDGDKEVPPGLPAPTRPHGDQQQSLGSEEDDALVSNKIVSLWSASPEIMDQIAGEENPQEQHKPKL